MASASRFKVGDRVCQSSRLPSQTSGTVQAVHPPRHEADEHHYTVRCDDGAVVGGGGCGLTESRLEACPRFKVGDAVVLWPYPYPVGSGRARVKEVVERGDGGFHYTLSIPDQPDRTNVWPGQVRAGYSDAFPAAQQFELERRLWKARVRLNQPELDYRTLLYIVLREVRPDWFEDGLESGEAAAESRVT